MRKLPKATTVINDQSITLKIQKPDGTWFDFYFLDYELRPLTPEERYHRTFRDGGTICVANLWSLHFFETGSLCCSSDRDLQFHETEAVAWLNVDTARLFKVLTTRFAKKVGGPLTMEKFRLHVEPSPILTINQIIHHPNAGGDMAKTLVHFKKIIGAQWERLLKELSHYLTRAHVYGQGKEFYFDGRRLLNGCGFNGGFIIHKDNQYSIHT